MLTPPVVSGVAILSFAVLGHEKPPKASTYPLVVVSLTYTLRVAAPSVDVVSGTRGGVDRMGWCRSHHHPGDCRTTRHAGRC